jgi:hypothetical protein
VKKLREGKELAPDDLARVEAKIEIVGGCADMEKVRNLLNGLTGRRD